MAIGANAYTFQDTVTIDPSSVPANTVQKETFTVTGLRAAGGPVRAEKRTDTTGVAHLASRISADDTLELTFWNYTGSAVNPASQTYYVVQL